MPSKSYALERGGLERVGVSWEGAFKEVSVTFDGQPLGFFATAGELETPQLLPLPDGSRIEVVLAKAIPFPELQLTRDGEPLPGTSGDPHTRLDNAANMLFAIAVMNAVLGLLAAILDVGFLKSLGVGWASVVTAVVYAGLATLVKGRSWLALAIAIALFILDGLYMFVAAAAAKVSPPIGGMIARILFLLPMFRGFGAIRDLNRPPRVKRPRPTPAPARASASLPSASPPAAGAARASVALAAPPPPQTAKTLTGDAERLRLKMTEKHTTSGAVTTVGRRVETKGPAGVDTARKSLRFIAHRVEISDLGLRVTLQSGEGRELLFDRVVGIVARQLPPDPPWDGALIVDVVPSPEASPEPVRIFGTTTVNYAAIPGGSTTSRLDNTRRLTAFLRDHCPNASLDEATQEFVRGPKVPLRFANMTQFIEYDSTYG